MTENELTKTIAIYKKTLEVTADNGETCFRELDKNTLSFLEELEQYRTIGTIEEFKALKDINRIADNLSKMERIEFKALKEKNEPKKAIGKRKYDEAYCPACNEVISDGEFWALDEYVHHCNYCGQAVKGIDWSE